VLLQNAWVRYGRDREDFMDYRFLGKTGVRVSKLGLGTMTFGREADRTESAALFAKCREAGINLFDCANVYAEGASEEILGQLITTCRNEVVLCTKAYFPMGRDVNARGTSRYHLVRAVEASLQRLKTDRIDVFYLHRFDDSTSLEESLRGLEHLVQSGKVLYPAVSNFAAWQVARALGVAERLGFAPLVAVQPMYNLVKRQAESEILPMAAAENVAVIPYSPLGGGLLTGRYLEQAEQGRLRVNKMYATRYGDANYANVAARFCELAQREGVKPTTLAVAWVAAHPAVTAPLIGARNVAQLQPSLDAAEYALSAELYREIAALSPAPALATDRNEESTVFTLNARA
jgi:aryl-alcohol dehydrogenase-like predicted oxidoreductase